MNAKHETLLWSGIATVATVCMYIAFREGLRRTFFVAWTRPEYGHALIVPFIAAYLVWLNRRSLAQFVGHGSWVGVPVIGAALFLNVVGQLSSLFIVQQYAFVLCLCGVALCVGGVRFLRKLWAPILMIVLMIPLPDFLYNSLSNRLQLISSQLGVGVIRLFGISVFVEGNVIDLGRFKLQVAEACDGLRYLFPLMTIGFLVAYFYQAALWKRLVVFLSAIPLTVGMNSFRIGVIGLLVDRWGIAMAEGFLHEFEGWVVFMATVALMLLEIVLLSSAGHGRAPWGTLLRLPETAGSTTGPTMQPASRCAQIAFLALLPVGAALALLLPQRVEVVPKRADFVSFPMNLVGREGRAQPLDQAYLDTLQLDDYILADFQGGQSRPPVNLFIAWYNSQQAGRSAHSPRSCLPGGGWEIQSISQLEVPGATVLGQPLRVNRVMIQLGDQRLLVYYWFQQRGRIVTNEYLAKWYLFWDSLTRNRTDGALIRLTMSLSSTVRESDVEAQLAEFAAATAVRLPAYVPS